MEIKKGKPSRLPFFIPLSESFFRQSYDLELHTHFESGLAERDE